jgi:CRISPR system Cascade subunit CasD
VTVLLLRLAGPLQAWGDSSRFTRRDTGRVPTKSGVLGLLAAAEGRRRTDEIEDLARLRFGVRIDQPGRLERDFQTASNGDTGNSMPLSYRYYLADAVFVAAVEGDPSLVGALADALDDPVFPLYLGRRSCPITGEISLGVDERPMENALRAQAWQASPWYQRRQSREVELELVVDAIPGETDPIETRRDVPESFNPERREYGWREVAHRPPVLVVNALAVPPRAAKVPNWMGTVEEAGCI